MLDTRSFHRSPRQQTKPKFSKGFVFMVGATGIEPVTLSLEG
jgi:hypothetical protein